MQPLDLRSRNAILASSAACFLGAIALAPMSARSADPAMPNDLVLRPARFATPAPLPPLRAVLPRRDPFVGSRDESDMPAETIGASQGIAAAVRPSPDPLPPIPPGDATLGDLRDPRAPLPPNAGARDTVAVLGGNPSSTNPATPGAVVRAVIVGDRPYAVVEDAQTTRVVGVDGTIEGKRVKGIDMSGVLLDDGVRLPITKSSPTPEPVDDATSNAASRRNVILLPPGFKYEAPGTQASPVADTSKGDASAQPALAPNTYQPYTKIQPPGTSGVPLQPLPTQFGYGQPSYGQPGYQPPSPAPSPSSGPTFGQTF